MLTPAQVVDWAADRGLKVVSLTDHDTMAGVDMAMARGAERDIEVVPGVEMNAWQGMVSMHILGYWLSADHPEIQRKLAQMQSGRKDRNARIVDKLNRLGIDVTMEDLHALAPCGQIGRPHIARALVDRGVCRDSEKAFAQYLRRGAVAYAERSKHPAQEVIAAIRAAGGIAVLAHPAQMDPSLRILPDLFGTLKDFGLDGVEVYYPAHSVRVTRALYRMAHTHGLVMTGGSDFHGSPRKGKFGDLTERTFRVPYHLYPLLKEKSALARGKEL